MANPWDSVDPPSYEVESWNSFDGDVINPGACFEVDSALPSSVTRTVLTGVSSETESALPATLAQVVAAAVAIEVDSATIPIEVTPSPAVESDVARALSQTVAIETDSALDATVGLTVVPNPALETSAALGGISPVAVVWSKTSDGSLNLAEEDIGIGIPEFRIEILDPIIERGPGVVTFTVSGGIAEADIEFFIDGDLVWETTLDSSGSLEPSSVGIYAPGGADVGTHTLSGSQQLLDTSFITASADYEVLYSPYISIINAGTDADPVEVDGAVSHGTRHWVFQDLYPTGDGGIGSYILPINPSEMTSPHWENQFSSRRTLAKSGQFHIFQAGMQTVEWKFSGYAPTQEMVEKLQAYRGLNRRFYVIDHHNRAWKVVFVNVDLKARLRHNFNDTLSDWGHDYEVTALITEQEWKEPV